MSTDRRTFLKLLGTPAVAAALPDNIARLLAAPANRRTGTLADVEHVIFLMQENRSFDHYFGTLRGVRGFADPRAVKLPSGDPVWRQPNGSSTLLPFRPNAPDVGKQFLPDPPHGWNDGHLAWNWGRFDRWVEAKGGPTTMTFHRRRDIAYQFALADAFTICDAYHCSIMGPTDPNRYHMWTGWVGNDGKNGGPVITNAELGYDWSTYPERLQRAGISWKVYQDEGVGLTQDGFWGWTSDAYIGNYGDNSLLYFHQYQNAPASSPLARNARRGTSINNQGRDPRGLVEIFKRDVERRQLPQVSWIVAPEAYSEHPNWPPDYGAWYLSQFIDVLADHPEVFGKSVLFITFDEEGGFFDHMVPPTPPFSRQFGLSTVPITNEIFLTDGDHPSAPYGLGVRVPMLVISPWSKGGWVNSQVFDHTSLIQFLESRFANGHHDLIESNITPWRRAVTGDLTTAFDFARADDWDVDLPSTIGDFPPDFVPHPDQPPTPPAQQVMPGQERGVRPARALPYELHARGELLTGFGQFRITFQNTGDATAVFAARSANGPEFHRTYTVEPRMQVSDTWLLNPSGGYDVSVTGPNGFLRAFRGRAGGANLAVRAEYQREGNGIALTMHNNGLARATLVVFDRYQGKTTTVPLDAGETRIRHWPAGDVGGWYDLQLTVVEDRAFLQHWAGHIEDGRDSISDPLMGGLV